PPRFAWPCSSPRPVATASRTCARSICGPWRRTSRPVCRAVTSVGESLTAMLLAPRPWLDDTAWAVALRDARSILADVAVRRASAVPFRVTDHEVRVALRNGGVRANHSDTFAWTA